MSDNGSPFFASPFPSTVVAPTGDGDDDSVQHAILTSHAASATDRNVNATVSGLAAQVLNRDILDSSRYAGEKSFEARYDAVRTSLESEVRMTDKLARIDAKLQSMEIDRLKDQLASERKASQDKTNDSILAALTQLLAK